MATQRPALPEKPAEATPRTTRIRSGQKAGETAEQPQQQSRQPAVLARDLKPGDLDPDEDFDLIEAARLLAHITLSDDLVPFREHLSPSDYLPPEERQASWLGRIRRETS